MRIQFDRCLRDPLARPFGATCAQGTGSVRISREDRQVNTLSASNNLSLPDTYGRVIGGEGESLSPAVKKTAPVFTRGRFSRHASRAASGAARHNGGCSQTLEMSHPRPRHFLRTYLACLLGLTASAYSGWGQGAWAEGRSDFVRQVITCGARAASGSKTTKSEN